MDTKIKKLLDSNKIKYKILPHRKVYTAFNAAETQHVDTKSVVKTVFLKLSKTVVLSTGNKVDGVLVAVPAGKRVDLKKAGKTLKATAKLSSEKDITKILKTKIGLLHPFGQLWDLPILMDKKLANNKKLVVSAGSYTESLEISVKDYIKLVNPLMGSFTQ